MNDPSVPGDATTHPDANPAPLADASRSVADPPNLSPAAICRLQEQLRASQAALARQNARLRQTQSELAEARACYADLHDFAATGYLTVDAAGLVLEANFKSAAMLDHERQTLVGHSFFACLAAPDHAAFDAFLSRVLETGRPETLEIRVLRRDKTHFYAEIAAAPHLHPHVGARMALTDVTARLESAEALRQAGLIIEASPAFLIRYRVRAGQVGLVEYVSSNVARFGYSREEILSGAVSPRRLVHPDDLPRVAAALRKNAAKGLDAFALTYRLRTRSGQTRYVTDHTRFTRDPEGHVDAVQSLALDITDSALARRDLETVLDSAPIPIVKVRLAEDGDRIVEYQNPAAAKLFGEAALGASCKSFLCNTETCPALGAESGVVRERECAVTTLYGQRVMYKTARKLPDAPYIIEAMVDVTELMRTRQRLTQAIEAAEAGSQAKSDFLATMSHEIRTPINGIMGMTELALQTELTDEQREYLDLARQSALSLLDIINDILDFSRIEAGRMELVPAPFSPRQMLTRCLRLFDTLAARQKNSLSLRVAPDVPETLIGDAGRLAQIVCNLVSNGLKFTQNGTVRLSLDMDPPLPDVPVAPAEAEGVPVTLRFRVADTGIGIPADKQERIFDVFTQLDASLTRGVGGTGLGLSICKSLVALMGGRLWLTSEPGQGSTFFFTSRCHRPADVSHRRDVSRADADQDRDGLQALSILLVEDNCINQLVAKRLLERRGHGVTAVDTGQAALALLRKTAFDCVLLDVEMPGLNGLETLARLRDPAVYGERAAVPVVALTAHAVRGYRERMLAAGFDDYVSKPIDMRLLDAALRRAATSPRREAPHGNA